MGERAADERRYTAFLSYSHQDAAAAGRLHRRLETYRMPKRLIGLETAQGPVPERLAPIFRDRDELPAATDLSQTVREALAGSGALVVLCSPNAAGSLWVAEEIRVFRELHPDRPILAAVLDGDPPDCFPATLRAFGRDGTWHEPLATDLRRDRDGARLGLLKLVAGITGVGLDALVQRDASRRVRRVMAVTVGAVVAMLMMAALAVVALNARREAERQRAAAEGQIEFMLTDLRTMLKGVGRLEILTAVNRRALSYYGGQRELRRLPADSLVRRARVLLAVGEDELSRDHYPSALAAFREAHRTTAEQLARAPNDAERIFAHSQSEFYVGHANYVRHNYADARRAFNRYKALTERLLQIDAANPAWLREAGFAEGSICSVDLAENERRSAMPRSCSSALARVEQAWRVRGDPASVVALANRHAWMVDFWSANGRWDRATSDIARAEELARSLLRRDPRNSDYQDLWMGLQFGFGRQFAEHGAQAEARRRFEEAAVTAAALRARDPENANWRDMQRRIENSRSATARNP
jgi:tetratricopeptide (TPR) repeat protein